MIDQGLYSVNSVPARDCGHHALDYTRRACSACANAHATNFNQPRGQICHRLFANRKVPCTSVWGRWYFPTVSFGEGSEAKAEAACP